MEQKKIKFEKYVGSGLGPQSIVDSEQYEISKKTVRQNSYLCSTLCIILNNKLYYPGAHCYDKGLFKIIDEFRILESFNGKNNPELAYEEMMNNCKFGLYP